MEEREGRQEDGMLLTPEEKASLPLLEPFFARYFNPILETLSSHHGSDPSLTSLLSDDFAVACLKRSQQEYLPSLLDGEKEGSVGREGALTADSRDPFGLGSGLPVANIAHFLISIQPLLFDAFGARPHLYHRVWNGLLKVVFRDIDLAMRESLTQRDELVKTAVQDMNETRRARDLLLSKQALDEGQRQTEHRTVVHLLTTWLTKTSELAQEMGTPLNVILGRAESLLERTEDEKTQASLQSILRQVERLISLRQELCNLDRGCGREPD